MGIVAIVLVLFEALTIERFFVLSFLGFLAFVELIFPFANVIPHWRTLIRWMIVVGVLIFTYILINHIYEMI